MHDEQADGNMNTQCDSTGAYTQIRTHLRIFASTCMNMVSMNPKKTFFHAVLIHPLVFMSNVRTCYMCTQVPVPRHTRTCKLVFSTQIAADQTPCCLYIHLLVWTFWTMKRVPLPQYCLAQQMSISSLFAAFSKVGQMFKSKK